MKTISKAAYKFASTRNGEKEIYHRLDREAFTKGVEFAQRWIPVEEELPEFTTINNHNAVNVKYKTINGEIRECTATFEQVSQHCFNNSPSYNCWFVYPSSGHVLKTVISWRPIEFK